MEAIWQTSGEVTFESIEKVLCNLLIMLTISAKSSLFCGSEKDELEHSKLTDF